MTRFNFLSLPLKIQEKIVAEIVHNSVPSDRIHFAQTSKYSNLLVKRAKPKKIITRLEIKSCSVHNIAIKINGKIIEFKTISKLYNILKNCQIRTLQLGSDKFFSEINQWWNSKFKKVFYEAAKFVTEMDICMKSIKSEEFMNFYKKLKHLRYLGIYNYILNIFYLPKFPQNIFLFPTSPNEKLDNFLQILAEKTRKCPLKSIYLKKQFNVKEVKQFLKNATFFDGAKIYIETDSTNHAAFLKMMKSLGKHEEDEVSPHPYGLSKSNKKLFAIFLQENVRVVLRSKKHHGVFLIPDLKKNICFCEKNKK
uniref:F-box domain-containing protein n=1 Tax=Panagrolaimus sp. JU765 TaxID=591449 RepID=A0AC34Q239_9BILA